VIHHATPDLIRAAREARGVSQQHLAKLAGLTQGTVSRLETGVVAATDETLEQVAHALGYPAALFVDLDRVYELDGAMFHRRRTTTPLTRLRQLRAQVNLMRIHISRILEMVELQTDLNFQRLDLEQYVSPEAAASALRAYWKLPLGPIDNLVATIEAAGAVVHLMRFPTATIDAAAQWPPAARAPYFFLNDEHVGERLRMTTAHEIAHMVGHLMPGDAAQEDEANRFAASFLMPPDEIRPDLEGLTLAKAFTLKPYWKVSAAAIVRHAYTIGAIDRGRYTTLFQQLSRHGYRRVEPNPLAPESPRILHRVIDYCRTELKYTVDELAAVARLTSPEFRSLFLQDDDRPQLRVVTT
jgi:Zn-dependent peptidase ImmA (M78 family)/transcriptional regulator with XRE-family HTH domain